VTKNLLRLNHPYIKIHTEARVLILDPDSIHKTIEITGIEYSVKRKPRIVQKRTRRTIMTMIKEWLDKVKKAYSKLFKKALTPKKQTKRKTNVKRTTRKKSK
jgi:hypothetical protein